MVTGRQADQQAGESRHDRARWGVRLGARRCGALPNRVLDAFGQTASPPVGTNIAWLKVVPVGAVATAITGAAHVVSLVDFGARCRSPPRRLGW